MKKKWVGIFIVAVLAFQAMQSKSAKAFAESQWLENLISKRQFLRWNDSILETVDLAKFYSQNQFASVWVDSLGRRTEVATYLRNLLLSANRHGLRPSDYWNGELEALFNGFNERNWISFEIAASEAFVRYAKDVSIGKVDPALLEYDVKFLRRKFDSYQDLVLATKMPSANEFYTKMDSLAPKHPMYGKLAIGLYRLRAESSAWYQIVPSNRTLQINVRDYSVVPLRNRLKALGYVSDNNGSDKNSSLDNYDEDLANLVRRFQNENNLVSDGTIGPKSKVWDLLNVPLQDRINSIELSMERLRWLPASLEPVHAVVNVASTEFFLNDPNRPNRFRVVTGRPFKRTPMMRDQIYKMELNPTWTVPFRIAVDDKLRHQQKDPNFFASLNIRVYDSRTYQEIDPATVDWSTINEKNFWFTLIQDPGISNSLGVIKFHLELNRDDIYMHDTNERYLFPELERHRSSGCIRLEKPFELSDYLLARENTDWTSEKIQEAVATENKSDVEKKIEIPLRNKLPVYILYLTSTVDDQGGLKWFPDVYGQDDRLRELMDSRGKSKLNLDFTKAKLPITGWGQLSVSGDVSPTQIFSKIRAVRCDANVKSSCDDPIEFDLNQAVQVPTGLYMLGFENSVYPGFVEVVQDQLTQKTLSRLDLPKNFLNTSGLKVYRDVKSETEKKKVLDELFYNRGLLFEQASFGFGEFYIRTRAQLRALPELDFSNCNKVASAGPDSDDYSLRAKAICNSWVNASSSADLALAINFSPAGRSDAEVDSEMATIQRLDGNGDLVPLRFLKLLVAPVSPAPMTFLSVFPGQYRISKPGQRSQSVPIMVY